MPARAQCTPASPCATSPMDLGALDGSASRGLGISHDGTVVVGRSFAGFGVYAFRWSGGAMTNLGALPGSGGTGPLNSGTASQALGVSGDGAVVVGYSTIVTGPPAERALRWANGTMEELGTLQGGSSRATSTNFDGSVVVGTSDGHAFRWAAGVMSDLGTLGGSTSAAYGVSAPGTVVVGESATAGGAIHAFRWSGGAMSDLGTLSGGDRSAAYGVSANGTVIVGVSNAAGGSPDLRAVRWADGTIADLGTLGGARSAARGVSANGAVVVGESTIGPDTLTTRAFRWTSATGMQSLSTLLASAGIDMTGITINTADAVSGNGQFITGSATFPGQFGLPRAYLVRYDDGAGGGPIAGMTHYDAVKSSVDQLGKARAGLLAQQHGFTAPLLGDGRPMDVGSEAGVYATAGSLAAGGYVRHAFGGGFAILGGIGYAREDYRNAELSRVTTGAAALQYVHASGGWLNPFLQAGGWFAPDAEVSFSRTYANGAGTATGTGRSHTDMSYVYARAGLLMTSGRTHQIALSAEVGTSRLSVQGYAEPLSASNPFEAHIADGADVMKLVKARLEWSQRFTAGIDGTAWIAAVHAYERSSGLAASVPGFGALTPDWTHPDTWVELGARLGYKLTDAVTLDLQANGVTGGAGMATRVHSGLGVRIRY